MILLLLTACTVPFQKREYQMGYREVGLASWYGRDFHGKLTASGEIYNMFELSAAHKSLPIGSLLLVTHLETGKRVKVKVNDRGPFVINRILDLSYGAAKQLGIVGAGVSKIELKVIGRAPIYLPGTRIEKQFFVQVGAFQNEENAFRLKEKIGRFYRGVTISAHAIKKRQWYRVSIGPYMTEEDARSTIGEIRLNRYLNRAVSPIVTTQ